MTDHVCTDILLLIDGRGRPMELRCERLLVDRDGKRRTHKKHRRNHDVGGVEQAVTTWTTRP